MAIALGGVHQVEVGTLLLPADPQEEPVKIPRDLRQLARRAEAAGWTITLTSNNHLAWKPPSGRTVFCPSTPSDHRSVQNVIGKLRRAGLNTR